MIVDPANTTDDRQIAAASLRTFMRLPVAQRSCVILMDVLGYSLQEISNVIDSSIPAVKAALNRGRTRLRELAEEPDDPLPVLSEPQRSLLNAYVHASMPAISMQSATCSPTRCASNWSTRPV
jgi:RNA polymerase sigma-70 factor (ECF subfamily)